MKWLPKRWNDVLALIVLIGFPAYWLVLLERGYAGATVSLIIGQMLGALSLVAIFYFRKKGSDEPPAPPAGGS